MLNIHFTRRQLLAGGLTACALGWLNKKMTGFEFNHNTIPGEMKGVSSRLGHRLRSGSFPEPTVTSENTLVIIGAGISGLAAGYRLAKAGFSDFSLLELEPHTGGNACSSHNSVSAYPWGAHYVPLLTEEASCVRRLFQELGIITGYNKQGLPHYNEYFICHDPNERLYHFGRWQEGLVPSIGITADDKAQYQRFFDTMKALQTRYGTDAKKLFAIPVDMSSQDAAWLALDKLTFNYWLKQEGFTSKPLRWYLNYCCRDDFGTTLENTSAWAGLHYFAARNGKAANTDSGSVITWPEGNGWLAQQLSKPIQSQCQTQSLCYSVHHEKTGVSVNYFDVANGISRQLKCKAAIIATPRFIASRLLQSADITLHSEDFSYSPWAVANITLSKLPEGNGVPLSWDNVVFNSSLLGYVTATHQITQMNPTATVLTYYWPLSHLEPTLAREEALARTYPEWQHLFLKELLNVHPELTGYVECVDIWLWGHGMIRPTPNFIWGQHRRAALIQHPPIFTAHSDMSGISIFEEAYTQGVHAAEQALTYLKLPYTSEC